MLGEPVKRTRSSFSVSEELPERLQAVLRSRWALACLAVLGVLLLMWPVSGGNKGTVKPEQKSLPSAKGGSIKTDMERELSAILSEIDGAGNVAVSITLASEGISSFAVNTKETKTSTEETDKGGTVRKTADTSISQDVVMMTGNQSPLLVEKKSPQVKGVLVVAAGASDSAVKERIMKAVATLLDIPASKVLVLPRE